MLLRQVGLITQSASVSFSDLTRVAAALSKQVARDFAPLWDIQATVDAFHRLQDLPLGYWPVVVKDNIGFNAAGIHLDRNNQPYALVTAGRDWSLTASHEVLEMLADPFGNRVMAGDSPMSNQGRVEFLVEVCDPSEATQFGYSVNSILVSDFYTTHYFDPVRAAGVQYSFTGAITEPRQVLQGGYLSWRDPVTDEWWQETFFTGNRPRFRKLGRLTAKGSSLRSQIDQMTNKDSLQAMYETNEATAGATDARAEIAQMSSRADRASAARAEALQAEIDILTGGPRGAAEETAADDEPAIRRPRGRSVGGPSAEEAAAEGEPPPRRPRGRSSRDD
jgi:hypothetical protein